MKFVSQLNEDYIPTLEIDKGKIVKNPETPERLKKVLKYFETFHERLEVKNYPLNLLFHVHPKWYVQHIKELSEKSKDNEYLPEVFLKDRIFDSGTPVTFQTYNAALSAVNATLTGAEEIVKTKENVYVITRPPGHHATTDFAGGYCFFNNAAIASTFLYSQIKEKICILDIDFHHGNGTQSIFYENPEIVYISIHGTPEHYFPWISGYKDEIGEGKGKGTNFNFPLSGKSSWNEYSIAFEKALDIITKISPAILVVSLGYDTHIDDPIGDFKLESRDFFQIGYEIKNLKIPTLFIQEGGYNKESNFEAASNLFKNFEKEVNLYA
ncbi:histone deacetylase family protein [Thermosipho atlanticus]|uniref:Acetoin utilization deacetylase AcuC n=1 Tax=Thermosipho atlanticus DSM 15807 TaxID=1123380 RepID=A0A1M5QUH5_9BACT|nr:histone deacetylase family protein [Thermosipho atlanticus]SHH17410.1 Acetoin utilization deacetylase AcuC [Thermosipho atlanticus DSM 15807]